MFLAVVLSEGSSGPRLRQSFPVPSVSLPTYPGLFYSSLPQLFICLLKILLISLLLCISIA